MGRVYDGDATRVAAKNARKEHFCEPRKNSFLAWRKCFCFNSVALLHSATEDRLVRKEEGRRRIRITARLRFVRLLYKAGVWFLKIPPIRRMPLSAVVPLTYSMIALHFVKSPLTCITFTLLSYRGK